jgi:hypothetical protein
LNRFGFKASANFPVTSFLDTCGHLLPIISEKERFFCNACKYQNMFFFYSCLSLSVSVYNVILFHIHLLHNHSDWNIICCYFTSCTGISIILINIFSSPVHRPCELLSCVSVRRPSVRFSHLNLLLWNRWTEISQTCQKCSLDGPLPDLCFWCWFEIQHGCQGP